MSPQAFPMAEAPIYRSPFASSKKWVLAVACLVGTGGFSHARYFHERHDQGYAISGFHGTVAPAPLASRTAAGDLARIREVLEPAVSDLARLFGVSRQTIYNWNNGEQPKAEFAARLEDLARAADVVAGENLKNPGLALKRKISDGKTLLDVVASGGSAHNAAQKLVMILRRETEERKRLHAKLSQQKTPRQQYDEFTSPILDEDA